MIEDVSRRLLGDFSSCLRQRIVAEQAPPAVPAPESAAPQGAAAAPTPPPPPPPPAKPVNGLRLFFQVLGDRIRRLFKRSR
jgi:hypothetical protein